MSITAVYITLSLASICYQWRDMFKTLISSCLRNTAEIHKQNKFIRTLLAYQVKAFSHRFLNPYSQIVRSRYRQCQISQNHRWDCPFSAQLDFRTLVFRDSRQFRMMMVGIPRSYFQVGKTMMDQTMCCHHQCWNVFHHYSQLLHPRFPPSSTYHPIVSPVQNQKKRMLSKRFIDIYDRSNSKFVPRSYFDGSSVHGTLPASISRWETDATACNTN